LANGQDRRQTHTWQAANTGVHSTVPARSVCLRCVGTDDELPAQKILAKVFGEVDDRNEFFAGYAPIDLASTQCSSSVSYDSFVTVLDL